MLIFRKTQSVQPAAAHIADTLCRALAANNRVLWLVPGGSSAAVAVAAASLLAGQDLHNLTVTLTDERYGPPGHKDSNWLQLQRSGFVLPGARLLPVQDGGDRQATATRFNELLGSLLESHDFSLGLFGIGSDGHIAGILPGSEVVSSQAAAVAYDAGAFERISMTLRAIGQLDEAVVYATGSAKQTVLDRLEESLPLERQPAQILKSVPNVTIYNDCKGVAV